MSNGFGDDDSFDQSQHTNVDDNLDEPLEHSNDFFLDVEQAEAHDYIGTPVEDSEHWHLQSEDFNCAPEVEREILEAFFGQDYSEIHATTECAQHGWLTIENGTPLIDSDKLLQLYGIHTHQVHHASVEDIIDELSHGHKIIVGVDGQQLISGQSDFPFPHANHAIWVTGVDKTDPEHLRIVVNDSADPNGAGKSYAMEEFVEAWKGSDFFYTATDDAPGNLHKMTPDFNSELGVFTEIENWVKDHLPSGGSLMGGMALAGSTIDLVGRERVELQTKRLKEKIEKRIKGSAQSSATQEENNDPELQLEKKKSAATDTQTETKKGSNNLESTAHYTVNKTNASNQEQVFKGSETKPEPTVIPSESTQEKLTQFQGQIIQKQLEREQRKQQLLEKTSQPYKKKSPIIEDQTLSENENNQSESVSTNVIYLNKKIKKGKM